MRLIRMTTVDPNCIFDETLLHQENRPKQLDRPQKHHPRGKHQPHRCTLRTENIPVCCCCVGSGVRSRGWGGHASTVGESNER